MLESSSSELGTRNSELKGTALFYGISTTSLHNPESSLWYGDRKGSGMESDDYQ
jgi:hypothetical protein